MSTKRHLQPETEPVRVLGRGLRAQRGVRLTMRAVREAAGKTQLDVAAESQMDQADVSRLESREEFDDCQVSTLRRYVTALGGNLELVAAFGNKKIVLSGVEAGAPAMTPAHKNQMQRTGESSYCGKRRKGGAVKIAKKSRGGRMTAAKRRAAKAAGGKGARQEA